MPHRGLALCGAALAATLAVTGLLGLLPGCPVLAVTGLPCPTCGTTRALHLLFAGDLDFLRYNPVWAVAALPVFMAVILARARPAAVVAAAGSLAAAGWVMAMVNLDAIRA